MWFVSPRKSRRNPPVRSGRNRFRPRLEALEDRCLLSLGAGSLDPTFGSGGTAIGPSALYPFAVALQPDGKIVVGGAIYANGTNQWALERFNADGSVDTTFGTSGTGIVSTVLGSNNSGIYGLAIDANDDIVAVGAAYALVGKNSDQEIAVARYTTGGSLDPAFGSGNGFVLTNVNPAGKLDNGTEHAAAVAIQGDGKILVGGTISNLASVQGQLDDGNFTLLRYNADGTLDTSFGNQSPKDGITITSAFGGSGDYATALALQSDGSIVLAGEASHVVQTRRLSTYYNSMAVARYSAAGQLDSSFGTGGTTTLGTQNSAVSSVVVQSNGAIVLAGTNNGSIALGEFNNGAVSLARLQSNGQLDTTFGSSGFATSSITMNGLSTEGLAQGVNGDLLAAGGSSGALAVAAFLPGGAVDTTFGTGGISTDSISGGVYTVGMAVQGDGKIVVAGFAPSSYDLARFLPPNTQIGWMTAAPNPVSTGSSANLTASNISDNAYPSTTIIQVSFYLDTDGNGTLDGSDRLLGTGTLNTATGVWSFTFSTTGLAKGTYTLFAQAWDGSTLYAPLSIQVTVQ